jgi:hypothetical protein
MPRWEKFLTRYAKYSVSTKKRSSFSNPLAPFGRGQKWNYLEHPSMPGDAGGPEPEG